MTQGQAIRSQDVETVLARLADVQTEMAQPARLEQDPSATDAAGRTPRRRRGAPRSRLDLETMLVGRPAAAGRPHALGRAAGPDRRGRPHPRSEPRADPPGAHVPRPPHAGALGHAAGRATRPSGWRAAPPQDHERRRREGLTCRSPPSAASRPRCAGLLAQQRALDVSGHNIANANTAGYTRQRADLGRHAPLDMGPQGLLGTGVDVVGFRRIRDDFIDVQLRAQTLLQGAADARQDGLARSSRCSTSRPTAACRLSRQVLVGLAERRQRAREPRHPPGARRERAEPRRRLQHALAASSRRSGPRPARRRHQHGRRGQRRRPRPAALNKAILAAQSRRPHAERPARPARPRARQARHARQRGRPRPTTATARSRSPSRGHAGRRDHAADAHRERRGARRTTWRRPRPRRSAADRQARRARRPARRHAARLPALLDTLAATLITQTNALSGGGVDANGVTQTGGFGLDGSRASRSSPAPTRPRSP